MSEPFFLVEKYQTNRQDFAQFRLQSDWIEYILTLNQDINHAEVIARRNIILIITSVASGVVYFSFQMIDNIQARADWEVALMRNKKSG